MRSRWPPKTYDVLLALVRGAGRLVTKRELLDLVWPEISVEEGILAVHISTLRKALGDYGGKKRYIETVSRIGYRFIAAVKHLTAEESIPAYQSVAVLPGAAVLRRNFFRAGPPYRSGDRGRPDRSTW